MGHGPQGRMSVWHYDTIVRKWSSIDPSALPYGRPQNQRSLRVVTYNIWLDRRHQPLRFQHLSAILQRSEAQIICLQEMTREVLQQLTLQPWVRDRYLLSDVDGRTFVDGPQSYGVVMLIEKSLDLQRLQAISFPTQQGRQLLLAQIQLRNEIVLVGTVHLESAQKNKDFRSRQLETCQTIFNRLAMNRPNVTCLLMGDFNFGARGFENIQQMNILHGWTDLWPILKGPNNPGNTCAGARLDRIMFYSSYVNPTRIRIIGNRPIGQNLEKGNFSSNAWHSFRSDHQKKMTDIFPSDHFGLMADFDLTLI